MLLRRSPFFAATAGRRAFSTTIDMTVDVEEASLSEISPTVRLNNIKERYPGMKNIPPRLLDMTPAEIRQLEHETHKRFGLTKTEISFIMKHKPTFLFWQEDREAGIANLVELLVDKYGFNLETVKTLVVKYPAVLSKSPAQIEKIFKLLEDQGIQKFDALKYIFECPRLISVNLEEQMKQTFLLFDLYHKIEAERVMEVFKHFPYLFCCDTHKMRLFMAQFRKYRFSQDQIINVCAHSGGLLACKVSNLTGLFDYMKLTHKIKASEVIRILDTYP